MLFKFHVPPCHKLQSRNEIPRQENPCFMFRVIVIMQMISIEFPSITTGEFCSLTQFFQSKFPRWNKKNSWKLFSCTNSRNEWEFHKVHLAKSFRSIETWKLVLLYFTADVELLCIYKEEFDVILKETMGGKHENIKSAIRRFDYFKNFTDEKVSLRETGENFEIFHTYSIQDWRMLYHLKNWTVSSATNSLLAERHCE